MKMKNMLIGGMSLALVACISVGGTLAYLSANTEKVTNTFAFTTNGIDLTLNETATAGTGYTIDKEAAGENDGIAYTDIEPGAVLSKVPVLTVAEDSVDCYVYALVSGIDNVAAVGENTSPAMWTTWGTNWTEVESYNGTGVLLKYNQKITEADTSDKARVLDPIFSAVTINSNITADPGFGSIEIKGYAIQANAANADQEAIDYFTTK